MHVAPIAAVADVALVVIGGGIGSNGDLLLGPIRVELERLLAYPPRSTACSSTGADEACGPRPSRVHGPLHRLYPSRDPTEPSWSEPSSPPDPE